MGEAEYKDCIIEMVNYIDDERALNVIFNFVIKYFLK